MTEQSSASGPDLTRGVASSDLVNGRLAGHVGDDEVLLVANGADVFAIAAHCSHYHGPLADGIVVGATVRCPWHHACFDLHNGEALRAPALSPVDCWKVERRDGRIFVREKLPQPEPRRAVSTDAPRRIVIVGGGGAGFAAAEMLRRRGYDGGIVMLSQDPAAPVDRPNLSKDYLAGSAPEEWVPLRPDAFYADNGIDLHLDTEVTGITVKAREVVTSSGKTFAYDRLLLATGAEPVRLPIPGADQPHVHTLRSLADSHAIIDLAQTARRAVVIGASFIRRGVAHTRHRGSRCSAGGPPDGAPAGARHGRLRPRAARRARRRLSPARHSHGDRRPAQRATLKSGGSLDADLVVVGVGVRPRLALAEKAGLAIDRGVAVNEFLETNAPGIFAAGDIARWPDPHSGHNIRVEHWVVAERQGQTAALNMLGLKECFDAVPFFWSQHYDVPINYVGHAEQWDEIAINGDIKAKDCLLRYKQAGRVLAIASIFRDVESLKAELAMEQGLAA